MASRSEKFIVGQSHNPVNPKDKFAIGDCKDIQAKGALEFPIPILYLEKPTRVTVFCCKSLQCVKP